KPKAAIEAARRTTEAIKAVLHLPRKSKLLDLIKCNIETPLIRLSLMPQLKMFRVTSRAENIEAMIPIVSVIANPLTGPEPSQNRIATLSKVVRFESIIALNAFW